MANIVDYYKLLLVCNVIKCACAHLGREGFHFQYS